MTSFNNGLIRLVTILKIIKNSLVVVELVKTIWEFLKDF